MTLKPKHQEEKNQTQYLHIPLVLLCLLGDPLLDLLAGLKLELVFTLLEGLLALRLVSEELHCPFALLVRTRPLEVCCIEAGRTLVRFTLLIGIWFDVCGSGGGKVVVNSVVVISTKQWRLA